MGLRTRHTSYFMHNWDSLGGVRVARDKPLKTKLERLQVKLPNLAAAFNTEFDVALLAKLSKHSEPRYYEALGSMQYGRRPRETICDADAGEKLLTCDAPYSRNKCCGFAKPKTGKISP
jgi:hypothetical protein